jgi:hypothetical protein|tara:strand:- start:3669 stop:3857 length:189 start_codon:yes stop_codon:yes gene_type:complete
MDEISLAEKLLKIISERRDRISDMLTGGSVKDFEEYKKLVGSIESLDYIGNELREILDKVDR